MDIRAMSDAEYFANPAIDQSLLKKFMVSPLEYVTALHNDVTTPAMIFGSAAHSVVLGSGADVQIKPNTRTKDGKQKAKELTDNGAILLSDADCQSVKSMADITRSYFKSIPGRPEIAMLGTDSWSGLDIKGKADWLPDKPDSDGVYRIRDYKTTGHDPRRFPYDALDRGYHIQAAFYMRLYRMTGYTGPLGFEFVVQAKTAPYDYMIWRIDEQSDEVEMASARIDTALNSLAQLVKDPDWEAKAKGMGLSKKPQTLSFTPWQMEREAESLEDESL